MILHNNFEKRRVRVAFVTLGCKLNFSETSTLARQFEAAGYDRVDDGDVADVYVVNTCSVTEHADKKCRQTIRKLHKENPSALIAVTGCYAQLKPGDIEKIDGVAVVIGAEKKGDLFSIVDGMFASSAESPSGKAVCPAEYHCGIEDVKTFFPAYSCGERTRSFLKVQDGCDYCCTYCTIPLARGGSRNPSVASLAAEAHDIAGSGVKEIVITGVNIAEFGRSSGESFLDLLKALNDVDGIERYRISSIEPNLLKEDMIRWMAGGTKFQKHFHIPLQCGSDAVLAAMKRRYNTRMFADKISMIRSIWGDVFFGIDVIAGFPAETDEEFCKSYDFIKNTIHPAFLHVFPYSMRANTPAALMPQVNDTVKTRRVEKLMALSDRLHAEYCGRYAGTRQKVLFESACKNGMMEGYTGNYIRVERPYDASCVGRIVEITL